MWNRILGAGAAAAVALGLAGGAFAADDRVEQIKKRGELLVCHAEALPWGIKDPKSGEWRGTDITAAKHLAESMGVKYVAVDSTWATLVPSVETDKCDIAMAPIFRTAERAMRILYADPSGYATQSVGIKDGTGLQTYADIDQEGKTIAVISGTADEAFANRFFKKATVKPFVTDKLSTVFLEVANGRADGVLTDSSTVENFILENPGMKLAALPDDPVNPQGYAYVVKPGEYHFRDMINVWQEVVEREGLREKWYMEATSK